MYGDDYFIIFILYAYDPYVIPLSTSVTIHTGLYPSICVPLCFHAPLQSFATIGATSPRAAVVVNHRPGRSTGTIDRTVPSQSVTRGHTPTSNRPEQRERRTKGTAAGGRRRGQSSNAASQNRNRATMLSTRDVPSASADALNDLDPTSTTASILHRHMIDDAQMRSSPMPTIADHDHMLASVDDPIALISRMSKAARRVMRAHKAKIKSMNEKHSEELDAVKQTMSDTISMSMNARPLGRRR